MPIPVVELSEDIKWADTCELVEYATLHLGSDSVCAHIAAAYGTPAVVVFGSTPPDIFGHNTATNLSAGPSECHPCFIEDSFTNGHRYGDICPIGGCTRLVTPDQIIEAAMSSIQKHETHQLH